MILVIFPLNINYDTVFFFLDDPFFQIGMKLFFISILITHRNGVLKIRKVLSTLRKIIYNKENLVRYFFWILREFISTLIDFAFQKKLLIIGSPIKRVRFRYRHFECFDS